MTLATRSTLAKTERNAEIVQRIVDGQGEVSLTDLSKEYGLTRSRIQRIVKDQGISMREMKRRLRVAPRSVCRQCRQEYVKGAYAEHCKAMGHRRITPPGEKTDRNRQIVDLYVKGGYNTTEIAEYFDVPQPVVTRILHRNGVRAAGRRRKKGGLIRDAVAQVE